MSPSKIYDAIPVKLVREGNITRPDPEFSLSDSPLDQLRKHLGVSIAYVVDRCGPVDIPRIQIAHNPDARNNEHFAVLLSGNGMYRTFSSAWSFITNVFQGIEAVYKLPQLETSFEIPVMIGHDFHNSIGRGVLTRGTNYTDIYIRVNEPMPEEMFDNLLSINFSYIVEKATNRHAFD